MELQGRYDEIRAQGLGLVAISYDAPQILRAFAGTRGITFPLLSDAGSAIIRRFGILNEQQEQGSRFFGIPHPGTFIVDRAGVVTARFFETAYQERYTAAAILNAQGAPVAGGTAIAARTNHLSMRAWTSDAAAAPGTRLSLVVEVTPGPSMHVYAPGRHSYQVINLSIDPRPWLRVHDTAYPESEIYEFKPLNERVEVYAQPFRLVRDVTVLASQEVQKLLAGMSELTITGALEYQACDDAICYSPVRIPLAFTLALKPLDLQPPDR